MGDGAVGGFEARTSNTRNGIHTSGEKYEVLSRGRRGCDGKSLRKERGRGPSQLGEARR